MRYTCPTCHSWVKDKFFFGLLHFCLTEEEEMRMKRQRLMVAEMAKQQSRPQEDLPGWSRSFFEKQKP